MALVCKLLMGLSLVHIWASIPGSHPPLNHCLPLEHTWCQLIHNSLFTNIYHWWHWYANFWWVCPLFIFGQVYPEVILRWITVFLWNTHDVNSFTLVALVCKLLMGLPLVHIWASIPGSHPPLNRCLPWEHTWHQLIHKNRLKFFRMDTESSWCHSKHDDVMPSADITISGAVCFFCNACIPVQVHMCIKCDMLRWNVQKSFRVIQVDGMIPCGSSSFFGHNLLWYFRTCYMWIFHFFWLLPPLTGFILWSYC